MEDIKKNYSSDEDMPSSPKVKRNVITVKNPYRVTGLSKVGWGKLKGQKHTAFLKEENRNYANWVINQGSDFRYSNTRNWLLKNLEKKVRDDLASIGGTPIKDLTLEQVENWVNFGFMK